MPDPRPLRSTDPREIAGYLLDGRLGEGGQGVVYLGRAPAGSEQGEGEGEAERVAVKILHAQLNDDPRAGRYFERELAAVTRVAPFCTARIIDSDATGDPPYIISEYIDGPSLHQILTDGPVHGPALHRIAVGTATALAAIHEAGVVHRDFKPANVLLGPDGPRVIDFGIARAIDSSSGSSSRAVGTPSYMAPEQLAGKAAGPPMDMFAWACTVACAANGRPPFGNDAIPAVMNRIVNDPPDLGDLTGDLRELVASCLDKDPDRRPTAPQALVRLLGGGPHADLLADGATVASAPPPARPEPAGPPTAAYTRPPPPSPYAPRQSAPAPPPTPPRRPPPGPYAPPQHNPAPPPSPAPAAPPPYSPPPAAPPPYSAPYSPPMMGSGSGSGPAAAPSPARRPRWPGWPRWPRWPRWPLIVAAAGAAAVAIAVPAAVYGLIKPGGGGAPGTESEMPEGADPALAALVPAALRKSGTLRAGMNLSYEPASFTSGDGPAGYEVELIREVGRRLGLRAKVVNSTFDTLLPAVQTGRSEVAMSSMSITQARTRQFFMVSYLNTGNRWVVRQGSPAIDPASACGKTVGALTGTFANGKLIEARSGCGGRGKPEITIREYPAQSELLAALRSGRLDAAVGDSPPFDWAVHESDGKLSASGGIRDAQPVGIVVAKEQRPLADAIRAALAKLIADGSYARILTKWNVREGAISTPAVEG